MSGRLPAWERLQTGDRRRLVVRPVERVSRDVLRVEDGDLPQVGDATVFDAWRDHDGYVLRAARIDGVLATPYLVRAVRLEIRESDGRLEALLGEVIPVGIEADLERLACACRGVSADAVYRAIGAGWSTLEELKRATRVTFGVCQGRRCVPWLSARLELPPDDPRAGITPRPPLVPVPASLLAAFAAVG